MGLFKKYIKTYSGLSPEVWMLSLIMLINRSGSVVLPFLSVYLAKVLHFDLRQTGIILTAYGLGSLTGSWLGGWLTDKFSSFSIQSSSLFFSGIGFLVLRELDSFHTLVIGFFLITVITDSFRPANASSIAQYSRPENLTKAYSLNRMAINLGFALGPAIGGVLAAQSFGLLFLADGLTCFAASAVFIIYFYSKQKAEKDARDQALKEDTSIPKRPYRDLIFVLFCVSTFGFAVVFFQLLNTLPLYYSESYRLNETLIGYLLGLNGLLVFLLEMPLVDSLSKKNALRAIVTTGTLMAGISYLIFNFSSGMLVLIVAMTLLSISEILVMPFLTTYTVNRAGNKSRGKYLGVYGMSYSLALIVAPALGTYLVDLSGFDILWYTMFGISILSALGFIAVIKPGDN